MSTSRQTRIPALHVGLLTSDLSHRHGWAHYSLSLLLALRKAGLRVTVIAARNSPDVEGIEIHRLLPNTYPAERGLLRKMLAAVPRAAAILRDCDLIHATIEPYAPLAAVTAAIQRRPLFVTAHGSYIPILARRRSGLVYRWAFSRAHIISVSRYTERIVQAVLPGVQTSVVAHGIDAWRFEDIQPLSSNLPKQGQIVLSVGAVKQRKGTLQLVQAMAEVRRHVPDVQCVIVGSLDAEPEYAARVQAAVDDLGLRGCVHLLGHVPESTLLGWYGAADVFALPSINVGDKFEGYGLVHLEASAAGLPVIGTTDCGAEDAVIDGVTGLLISQAQLTTTLPGAIISLLTNPARARAMGAAGRQRARSRMWDHTAQQLVTIYRSIMEGTQVHK